MTDLDQRITRLERNLSTWRAITCGLLVVLCAVAWSGFSDPPDWSKRVAPGNNAEFDVVTAKVVRVVSMLGTPVVSLTANARGDGLISLAAGMDTPTVLISADEKQRGYLALLNGTTKRTFEAKADGSGAGLMLLKDGENKTIIEMSAARRDGESIRLTAKDGSPTVVTTSPQAPGSGEASGEKPAAPAGRSAPTTPKP